jgi:hypothetical protein
MIWYKDVISGGDVLKIMHREESYLVVANLFVMTG